jgi:integration host factor subunit alpha
MPALNNTGGTLTKADLAQAVSTKTDHEKWRSAELVDTVFEVIRQTLESGEDVLISSFGKFSIRKKQERRGRNPQTGEPMMISPRKVVTFKCAGVLRNKINNDEVNKA